MPKFGYCYECACWSGARHAEDTGRCQRHAPVVVSVHDKARTEWPQTYRANGCWDHIPKEQKA